MEPSELNGADFFPGAWDNWVNQVADLPSPVPPMDLSTSPALSEIAISNHHLSSRYSCAPVSPFNPSHSLPLQAHCADINAPEPLREEAHSNGITADFNEPSMQSQVANMHGPNQALPYIDPSMQDPIPVQAQEQGLTTRTPQSAPHRGRRSARSRHRPYERQHITEQSTGVFQCEWKNCDQIFNRKGDRDRHVNTLHLSPGSNECPHCGRTFNRRDNLRQHLNNVRRGCNRRSSARGGLN